MIIFAGEQEKGWFVPEVCQKYNEECVYSGFISDLDELSKTILSKSYSAVILHLPTLYIMDYENISQFCKNLMIANANLKIICMAEGYNINSRVVQAAIASGVKFFMLGTNPTVLKKELCNAFDDITSIDEIFAQLPTAEQREKKKDEIGDNYQNSTTIAVVGALHRIGTTTQALQIVKHLLLEGYTACYIQINSLGYVEKIGEFYNDSSVDEELGRTSYQNIEMYSKQERIADILSRNYDYYIYDFGCISDDSFSLVQFLEKDIKIAVCGSKSNELPYIQPVLELLDNVTAEYLFSFTSETDQKDILELMEHQQKHTHFAGYIPDPFAYNPYSKPVFEKIIIHEKPKATEEKKKFRLFGKKKEEKKDGKKKK